MAVQGSLFSSKLLVIISLFYLYGILVNLAVRLVPSLHYGKDGGSVTIILSHLVGSYLFFIVLRRSVLAFLGLGFFIGLLSCSVVFLMAWLDNLDYNVFIFLSQLIATTIVVLLGLGYLRIEKHFRVFRKN